MTNGDDQDQRFYATDAGAVAVRPGIAILGPASIAIGLLALVVGLLGGTPLAWILAGLAVFLGVLRLDLWTEARFDSTLRADAGQRDSVLVGLMLPAVAAVGFAWGVRALVRALRSGPMRLRIGAPGRPGGALWGDLDWGRALPPGVPARLSLTCFRRRRLVPWKRPCSGAANAPWPPQHRRASSSPSLRAFRTRPNWVPEGFGVGWCLDAAAGELSARFFVPVFASAPATEPPSPPPEPVAPGVCAGVRVESRSDGALVLRFSPWRHVRSWGPAAAVGAALIAGGVGLGEGFGLFLAACGLPTLALAAGSSRSRRAMVIDAGGLTITGTTLGLGTRHVPREQLVGVAVEVAGMPSASRAVVFRNVVLSLRLPRFVTLQRLRVASGLPEGATAEWLAAEIRRRLGLPKPE